MNNTLIKSSTNKYWLHPKRNPVIACIFLTVLISFLIWRLGWGFRSEYSDSYYLARTPDKTVYVRLIFPAPSTSHPLMHYTEHLVWLNALDKNKSAFDRHSNAWTTNHAVGYWLSGPIKDLSTLISQLKNTFNPIVLPASFAEEERDIVMREYDYRYSGNPAAQASEAMDAFLYEGSEMAASVMGTPSQIKSFTYEGAKTLHAATHTPENAKLMITGNVTDYQVRAALKQANWPTINLTRADQTPPQFDLATPAHELLLYPDADAAPRLTWRRVVSLPKAISFDLLEIHTALLQDILDTNLPSGLAGPLRYNAAIAREFNIQIWPIDENNIEISFSASPDKDITLTELQSAFESELRTTAAQGIPKPTYERVFSRFNNFWPDWQDKDKASRWMASYAVDRTASLREPLSERVVKKLKNDISIDMTNLLLTQLAGEGRDAAAFFGSEEIFE